MPQSRWFPLSLAAGLAALACIIGALWGADQTWQWQLAARYTARVGFPVFVVAYAASSLYALWPGDITRTLLRRRRHWGLGFALTHSVHLVALTGYNMIAHNIPALVTLAGGGGAYAILYVMALTSNDQSMRAMGKWWKRLHTLGIHWLWFIYVFSYFGRIMDGKEMGVAPYFFPIALLALGLRVAVWMRRRKARLARAFPT